LHTYLPSVTPHRALGHHTPRLYHLGAVVSVSGWLALTVFKIVRQFVLL
jgi:hypothetical protein